MPDVVLSLAQQEKMRWDWGRSRTDNRGQRGRVEPMPSPSSTDGNLEVSALRGLHDWWGKKVIDRHLGKERRLGHGMMTEVVKRVWWNRQALRPETAKQKQSVSLVRAMNNIHSMKYLVQNAFYPREPIVFMVDRRIARFLGCNSVSSVINFLEIEQFFRHFKHCSSFFF